MAPRNRRRAWPSGAVSEPSRRGVSSSAGGADDERADIAGTCFSSSRSSRLDREPGGTDRLDGVAVAVAALGDEPVQAVQSVLPAGEPRPVRAHVLDEEQLAAGLEHAGGSRRAPSPDPRRCRGRASRRRNRRSRPRRAAPLPARARARPGAAAGDPPLEPARHRGVGLGERERVDRLAVVLQVSARAGADLEHPAGGAREQRLRGERRAPPPRRRRSSGRSRQRTAGRRGSLPFLPAALGEVIEARPGFAAGSCRRTRSLPVAPSRSPGCCRSDPRPVRRFLERPASSRLSGSGGRGVPGAPGSERLQAEDAADQALSESDPSAHHHRLAETARRESRQRARPSCRRPSCRRPSCRRHACRPC